MLIYIRNHGFNVDHLINCLIAENVCSLQKAFKSINLLVSCTQVYPTISSIKKGKIVEFVDGKSGQFDVIVFATGYRSNVLEWLKVHC